MIDFPRCDTRILIDAMLGGPAFINVVLCCDLQTQGAALKVIAVNDQSRGAESDRKPLLATHPGTSL